MIELEEKYVFHIPLYKCAGDELAEIEADGILDELVDELSQNGFDSLYMTKVESIYKSRRFDELLITVFASSNTPESIFSEWFSKNNDVLGQEAFAYEKANRMIINELAGRK